MRSTRDVGLLVAWVILLVSPLALQGCRSSGGGGDLGGGAGLLDSGSRDLGVIDSGTGPGPDQGTGADDGGLTDGGADTGAGEEDLGALDAGGQGACGDRVCGPGEDHGTCFIDCASPFGVFNDMDRLTGGLGIGLARELGTQRARVTIYWWLVEPERGRWEFDLVDRAIELHREAGIALIVTLKCVSPWGTLRYTSPTTSSPPRSWDDYEDFVRTVVERYRGRVAGWQIENEVFEDTNYPALFWAGTKEEYVELLTHASEVVRSADPGAWVVLQGFGDLLTDDDPATPVGERGFMEYVIEHAAGLVDLVDFHQYLQPGMVPARVDLLRGYMGEAGLDVPIISTEAGDPDLALITRHLAHPDDPDPFVASLLAVDEIRTLIARVAMDHRVTPEERKEVAHALKTNPDTGPLVERFQAEGLAKRLALTLGAGATQFYWVGIQDYPVDEAPDWYHVFMGLTDEDGRKKPHFYTYQMLIRELSGLRGARVLSQDPVVVRLDTDHGPRWLAWSDTGAGPRDLGQVLDGPQVTVVPIVVALGPDHEPVVGEESTAPVGRVPLSGTPVLLRP